jgi:hypothetical protein
MDELKGQSSQQLGETADSTLAEVARQLGRILAELASRIRPFPAFLNMLSVQAVELDPPFQPREDRGCVVVNPEGEVCQLELTTIAGVAGISEVEAIEQFRELELAAEEYIVYARHAIRLLTEELVRRGQ